LLIEKRFPEDEAEQGDENNITAVEKLTWLRWLFFVLGVLPPAVKLAAMTGVPWTKAWGMMFLASFFIVELLLISSAIIQHYPLQNVTWRESARLAVAEEVLDRLERVLAVLAFLAQLGAFFWVNYKIFPWKRFNHEEPFNIIAFIVSFVMLVVYAYTFTVFGLVVVFRKLSNNVRKVLLLAWIVLILLGYVWENQLFYYIAFLTLVFNIEETICTFFVIACAYIPSLNVGLLLSDISVSHDRHYDIHVGSIGAFCLFISVLFFALIGYAYIYDPSGTFNPTWTGVFG
jgi:hypothetical protein